MTSLDHVIATFREEATVLRANGHTAQAQSLERFLNAVLQVTADMLGWISESEAQLRSGKGPDYFRAHRQVWAEDGVAEKRNGRRWFYRRVIVPRRKMSSIARTQATQKDAT